MAKHSFFFFARQGKPKLGHSCNTLKNTVSLVSGQKFIFEKLSILIHMVQLYLFYQFLAQESNFFHFSCHNIK